MTDVDPLPPSIPPPWPPPSSPLPRIPPDPRWTEPSPVVGRIVRRARGAVEYLRARPVLVLLLMSPGLPEYLSGSSPLNALVLNPGWFAVQLGLNLGLYGPGVLLIREASIRWRTGFIPVLLLGAAYGILEEGIALSTMFNPAAGVVGGLGSYGHFMGVNTVWVPGVLMVHMVFSIGLPIFLLGTALPETRQRSLLSNRGIAMTFSVLATDVAVLTLFVTYAVHFWMGWPIFLGSFAAIAALIVAAYCWPSPSAASPPRPGRWGLWPPAIAGILLFVGVTFSEALGEAWGAPPVVVIAVVTAIMLAIGGYAHVSLRGRGIERRQLAFAFGLLAPIVVFGFFAQYQLDLVVFADAALVLWFARLLKAYELERSGSPAGSPTNPDLARGAI